MLANIGKPLVYPQLYLYLLTFSVLILPLCLCTTDNKDADLDSTFPLDEFVRRDLPRANSAPVLANGSQIVRRPSLGQQDPQVLPPVPIIPISEEYISNAQGNDTDAQDPASSRLRSRNIIPDRERWTSNSRQILKRDAESCGGGTQCADGSADGKCGFGPDYCGSGCQSNCDAAAMCGKYSLGGSQKCGMNLCCSTYGWCGTDDAHCSPTGDTPCQQGFGRCDDHVPPPSCSGTSTNTRTIGYYQVANTRSRLCNRISPEQIDTKGYTHLYLAFAAIDPKSFAVVPSDNPDATKSADAKQYSKFTALKSSTLQTWIAIGGFDFSDVGPTHTTWSDMVSTSANRAAFISSLKGFMAKYGFQGVDIDWEYPGTPDRGGKLGDTQNLVSLVKEMSASFNGQYGISLTLAPDYWYLRYFDPKAMEPYVNWFGFMAYDLHGSWDADVHTLGSIVRGQADVREIQNDTLPFWFDNLDPSKINLGLAAYGRGYTLSNPSCHTLECPFDGPNDPGECTNTAGIMSLVEIKNLVKEEGLTEHLLSSSMMKEISWGNQWIGYDDHDTWALKKKWANGLCFGGTMVWSVDMDSGQGSNAPSTQDGTCGYSNGGTICGHWASGSCCSSSGYCGHGDAYCGGACQSGACFLQAPTTDGTCGSAFGDSTCAGWKDGECCSGSGYCGSGDAYCGSGCQSGPCDSGDVPINKGSRPKTPTVLNANSSCQDLQHYQGLDSGDPNTISGSAGGLTRDMWDQVEATQYLNDWISHASDEDLTTFNFAFANPWGLGQSMSSCKPNAGCLRYDCNQFGDQINREKGAAAYMILISMQNVKLMLESLYGAAQYAWVYIDGTQAKFLDEFNPAMPDDNDLFTKELINGFAGLFAVAAAATGNPIAGAVGAFVSAISSGVLEAFPDSDDTRMSDLAALESAITLPLNKTQTSLTQMQTDFAFHGQSGNTHYTDIFPHGAVVDWRTVALLNEGLLSSAQLDQIFVRHVQAMVINWSWHAARTWIFSYPMTREDFDSRESQAGSNDFRLKHYYNGRGYFFQSVQATQEGAYVTPWVQNPPGWGALSSSNISFSTWDVIESSADGFDLGGYGYNPLDNINADFIKNASPDILSDSVKLPGFFNIPICPLDKSPLGVNDLDSFFGILAPVGARWSPGPENNGGTYNSPFCYCLGIKDQNGKAFEDEIDVKNWAYGQNDFCDSVV